MSKSLADLPNHFSNHANGLYCQGVSLAEIAARFGTPTYVYSQSALTENFLAYAQACQGHDALVCYAIKANANLAILNLLAAQGAGFDIVSGGELQRVIAAGGDTGKVIFSGVGKSREEIRFALEQNILCFNVESLAELERINQIAHQLGYQAPISLRVNPDIDAKTHAYISTGLKDNKFGIAFADAIAAYQRAAALPNLKIIGIDCHIGSQLLDAAPLLAALDKLIGLIDTLATHDIVLEHIDLGGGIGIRYGDEAAHEHPIVISDYLARVFTRIDAWRAQRYAGKSIKVLFEPGRSIVGNAGVLLTRIEYLKPGAVKNFAVVDAAMNDLMRPALYDAWHEVVAVTPRSGQAQTWEIVGPICESGDWLARSRSLVLQQDDVLAFLCAGAYGMAMASNYNTRPRAAEVLVCGNQHQLIRRRESLADLYSHEQINTLANS